MDGSKRHKLFTRATRVLWVGLLALLVTGCPSLPKVTLPVMLPPRVRLPEDIAAISVTPVEASRGSFQVAGLDGSFASPGDAETGEAMTMAITSALTRKPHYTVFDESVQQALDPNLRTFSGGTPSYRLPGFEAKQIAVVRAKAWHHFDQGQNVDTENVTLFRYDTNGQVTSQQNRSYPVYKRWVRGALRVDVEVVQASSGKVLFKETYAHGFHQGSGQAAQGTAIEAENLSGGTAVPDLEAVRMGLMRAISNRILRDISPYEGTVDIEIATGGDVMAKNLLVHGAALYAERRLRNRLGEAYETPAARASDIYNMGVAYLLQGFFSEAEGQFQKAKKIQADPLYDRGIAKAKKLLAGREAGRAPVSD